MAWKKATRDELQWMTIRDYSWVTLPSGEKGIDYLQRVYNCSITGLYKKAKRLRSLGFNLSLLPGEAEYFPKKRQRPQFDASGIASISFD